MVVVHVTNGVAPRCRDWTDTAFNILRISIVGAILQRYILQHYIPIGLKAKCLRGIPCRRGGRTDTRALPSLWHVTRSVASEYCSELPGSSPISYPSPRLASLLNGGPFPPPALPGFHGTTRLSVTPSRTAHPRGHPFGRHAPTTRWGFPCCSGLPLVCMPSPRNVSTTLRHQLRGV